MSINAGTTKREEAEIYNKRKRGCPRNTLHRDLMADVSQSGHTWSILEKLAQDRGAWRKMVGGLCPYVRHEKVLIMPTSFVVTPKSINHKILCCREQAASCKDPRPVASERVHLCPCGGLCGYRHHHHRRLPVLSQEVGESRSLQQGQRWPRGKPRGEQAVQAAGQRRLYV